MIQSTLIALKIQACFDGTYLSITNCYQEYEKIIQSHRRNSDDYIFVLTVIGYRARRHSGDSTCTKNTRFNTNQ